MQGQVRYTQNTSHLSSYCRTFAYHAVIYLSSLYDHYALPFMRLALPCSLDQVVPPLVISSSSPASCLSSSPSHHDSVVLSTHPSFSRPNLLCRWISDWPAFRFLVSDSTLTAIRSSIAPVTLQIRYFSYLAPCLSSFTPLDTY